VIELRFHHELYDGFAIDEAMKAFGEVARFETAKEAQGYVVKVSADGDDEEIIALELANYALGKTIEKRA